MSGASHLHAVGTRPLFRAESEVRSLADRLTILDALFDDNSGATLTEGLVRAVGRLIGEAKREACALERAWDAEYGDGA